MRVEVDLRDLTLAIDEMCDEAVDNAGKLCRDHGGTEDEIEPMRELQREWLEKYRGELRAWLERGGQELH